MGGGDVVGGGDEVGAVPCPSRQRSTAWSYDVSQAERQLAANKTSAMSALAVRDIFMTPSLTVCSGIDPSIQRWYRGLAGES